MNEQNQTTTEMNGMLATHTLKHNTTDIQRRCIGAVEYRTPYIELAGSDAPQETLQQVAMECSTLLNFLGIAQRITAEHHRANRHIGTHLYVFLESMVHRRSFANITQDFPGQAKHRAVLHRYTHKTRKWINDGERHQEDIITPQKLLSFCADLIQTDDELLPLMEDLRIALITLNDELHKKSILTKHEVYSKSMEFHPQAKLPFSLSDLIRPNNKGE
ncbi:hypothetical protein PDESU_01180 [Pontiella desulfatans]|uniref:Uncharacterized protein n=1 Tax=Pontiella desulfatans TaxID=2750659 RepID=A0A6C2TYD7_PONDE|nr:hypothetical protein [Pontiella desulfatans]VGO12627.1 hypothetical protein PDESU_01180 [Pontiella desulfatans]